MTRCSPRLWIKQDGPVTRDDQVAQTDLREDLQQLIDNPADHQHDAAARFPQPVQALNRRYFHPAGYFTPYRLCVRSLLQFNSASIVLRVWPRRLGRGGGGDVMVLGHLCLDDLGEAVFQADLRGGGRQLLNVVRRQVADDVC